jgi:hypothetical protein
MESPAPWDTGTLATVCASLIEGAKSVQTVVAQEREDERLLALPLRARGTRASRTRRHFSRAWRVAGPAWERGERAGISGLPSGVLWELPKRQEPSWSDLIESLRDRSNLALATKNLARRQPTNCRSVHSGSVGSLRERSDLALATKNVTLRRPHATSAGSLRGSSTFEETVACAHQPLAAMQETPRRASRHNTELAAKNNWVKPCSRPASANTHSRVKHDVPCTKASVARAGHADVVPWGDGGELAMTPRLGFAFRQEGLGIGERFPPLPLSPGPGDYEQFHGSISLWDSKQASQPAKQQCTKYGSPSTLPFETKPKRYSSRPMSAPRWV